MGYIIKGISQINNNEQKSSLINFLRVTAERKSAASRQPFPSLL